MDIDVGYGVRFAFVLFLVGGRVWSSQFLSLFFVRYGWLSFFIICFVLDIVFLRFFLRRLYSYRLFMVIRLLAQNFVFVFFLISCRFLLFYFYLVVFLDFFISQQCQDLRLVFGVLRVIFVFFLFYLVVLRGLSG